MTHDILEPAAFASLAVAALGIFLRFGGLRLSRVLYFRGKLRHIDQVVSTWERQVEAQPAGHLVRDERRNRRDGRRQ